VAGLARVQVKSVCKALLVERRLSTVASWESQCIALNGRTIKFGIRDHRKLATQAHVLAVMLHDVIIGDQDRLRLSLAGVDCLMDWLMDRLTDYVMD
jgi:hypothetical protein